MPRTPLDDVLRYLRRSFAAHVARDLTDGELLERFVNQREEAAVTILVQRHGPMVLSVCQRVLGNCDGAEDAFQATFMVLVRKAGSIGTLQPLSGWLYGVAQRIALKARARASQRRNRERRFAPMPRADALDDVTWQELRSVLDEEIARIPEKYRTPIVICYFEGKTYEQAAKELGLAKSSLGDRVVRGRELLRQQLVRRGLSLSAGAPATSLCDNVAAAHLPALLTIKTVKAAVLMVSGKAVAGVCLSAGALALAEEALAGMLGIKSKMVLLVMALGLAVGGAGWAGYGGLRENSDVPQSSNAQPPAPSHPGQPSKAQTPEIEKQANIPAKQDATSATDPFFNPLPPDALARLGSRFRHGGSIFAVAYSPDGKIIATGSGDADSTLRLWDSGTGRELRRLQRPGQVYAVVFSPDGKTLACASAGSRDALWDIATGREVRQFGKSWEEAGYDVAFSPDGKTLAAGGRDGVVHLWDVDTGVNRGRLAGHEQAVNTFVFSPSGSLLATAGQDKTVRLWDTLTAQEVRQLPPFPKEVRSVAFSPDSKMLATGCLDGSVALWDAATGEKLLSVKAGEINGDNRVAFSPDGKTLFSGGSGVLWDVATGKKIAQLHDRTRGMRALAFAPDGTKVAFEGYDRLHFLDPLTCKPIPEDEGHEHFFDASVVSVAFFPDGRTLASGGSDATACLWDVPTSRPPRTMTGKWASSDHVSFRSAVSPTGKTVAGITGRNLYVWDAATGKELFTVQRKGNWLRSVAFAPDGITLAAGGGYEDNRIRLWEVTSGKELRSFSEQNGAVDDLTFSPDGKLLASGGGDNQGGIICIWEIATGKKIGTISVGGIEHLVPSHVTSLVFSPNGKLLASTSLFGVLRIWDMATGKERAQLGQHTDSVAFSPDGQMLASTSRDKIELWEVATGKLRKALTSPLALRTSPGSRRSGRIHAVAFAPDGRTLATGIDDNIMIWDPTGLRAGDAGPVKRHAPREMDELWADLAGEDAAKAYSAMCTLAGAPADSIPFLKSRLPPAPEIKQEHLQALIVNLASDQFAVRQAAHNELRKLGLDATDFLQRAIADHPPLELKRRVELLMEASQVLPAETLRRVRAIEVLEGIGSKDAREILEVLAGGFPGGLETKNATASLRRLVRRDGYTQ